jgi:hypothetical protein
MVFGLIPNRLASSAFDMPARCKRAFNEFMALPPDNLDKAIGYWYMMQAGNATRQHQ